MGTTQVIKPVLKDLGQWTSHCPRGDYSSLSILPLENCVCPWSIFIAWTWPIYLSTFHKPPALQCPSTDLCSHPLSPLFFTVRNCILVAGRHCLCIVFFSDLQAAALASPHLLFPDFIQYRLMSSTCAVNEYFISKLKQIKQTYFHKLRMLNIV